MDNKKSFFYFFVLILFFLAGFFLITHPSKSLMVNRIPENIKSVEIAGQNIKVDLALTEAEQEQGLSGRPKLAENTGMLFIFDHPDKYPFWMKDMNFSIDMIWFSNDMKVVYIEKNALPSSYPEAFGPGPNDGNAEYVLEVSSGFADKNNLKVGDSVLFNY